MTLRPYSWVASLLRAYPSPGGLSFFNYGFCGHNTADSYVCEFAARGEVHVWAGTNGRQGKHGYWLSVTGASMSDVARIRVTVTLALPLLLR